MNKLEYVYMDIKETFLKLTSHTYPHGKESELFGLLPSDLEYDEFGNLFKVIGENPSTMFTSHLDTATAAYTKVNHVIDGDIIKTDGTSILGADDKAGVTILLYMIENKIPGLYYFFLGEEVGCVGSKKLSEKHKTNPIESIKKVVSFDRRGTKSIITHQCSSRCCSEEFGHALGLSLNTVGLEVTDNDTVLSYSNDDTGLYTDSAQFTKIYPECTNISVGYYNEHTFAENQNIKHLDKLAKAVILVDWEALPVSRDPSVVDYKHSTRTGYSNYYNWDDDLSYGGYGYAPPKKDYNDTKFFVDDEYGKYVSSVSYNTLNDRVTRTDLSEERLKLELDMLSQLMLALDVDYQKIEWTGFKLTVSYKEGHITECDRNDLVEFIPEFDFWRTIEDDDKIPSYGDTEEFFGV